MQIDRETTTANVVRAWEAGAVRIGEVWHRGHLILAADRIRDWAVDAPLRLTLEDLTPAVELDPEIILLGTGEQLVFPEPGVTAALAERHIGLEVMNTPAACRTFNVLVHERRRVVAAIFNFIGESSR